MELSLKELNDLYYCVGKTATAEIKMIHDDDLYKLMDKLLEEIVKRNED